MAVLRGKRRRVIGMVTSDKLDKTRRVELGRLTKHPRYGKYIRRRTVCHVHDGQNESHVGDTVEIVETRPLSRTKRWRLVRIIRTAVGADDAGRPAEGSAAAGPETGEREG